jgi:hypothetical protein
LEETILNRPPKKRGKKAADEETTASSPGETSELRVGYATVLMAVNAIVDLWTQQCNLNDNKNPHPRSDIITSKINTLKKQKNRKDHETLVDRGLGTMEGVPTVY